MDNLTVKCWMLDWPSANMRFVALAIARRSRETGSTWAKQKTIADDTGLSAKTVQRAMADMEEMDPPRLKRVERRRADGSRSSDMLWLTLPAVVLKAESVSANDIRRAKGEQNEEADTVSGVSSDGGNLDSDQQQVRESTCSSQQVDSQSGGSGHRVQGVRSESPGSSESSEESLEQADAREARELSEAKADGIDVDSAVEVIWRGVGDNGRRRSSKSKVRKALAAALAGRRRGEEPAEERLRRILMGVRAYLAHPDTRKEGGRFEHGAHRTLQDDVWESFLDDGGARQARGDGSAPDPRLGSAEEPGPALQRYWMENEKQGLPWHSDRGPRPGMPGCRVDPALQVEFGHTPWAPPSADDDDAAAFA